MIKENCIFAPDNRDSIAVIHYGGQSDTSSPRHHAKDSGFLFEYVLSGEECIESPEILTKAGIGTLLIVHPSEECVIYRSSGEVSAISLRISAFMLEAVMDVISLPHIFMGSGELHDKFLNIDSLYKKYRSGDGGCGRALSELAFSLLLDAAAINHIESSSSIKPSAANIKEYLDLCICADIDLDSVGKRFNITGMHVIRLFRNEYDITPMQYLKIKRLEKSASLLTDTDLSIKDISALLRFSSTQHYTNLFREHFGISPGKFRENSRS